MGSRRTPCCDTRQDDPFSSVRHPGEVENLSTGRWINAVFSGCKRVGMAGAIVGYHILANYLSSDGQGGTPKARNNPVGLQFFPPKQLSVSVVWLYTNLHRNEQKNRNVVRCQHFLTNGTNTIFPVFGWENRTKHDREGRRLGVG